MGYFSDCLDHVISLQTVMAVNFENYIKFDSPKETSKTSNHHSQVRMNCQINEES